MKSVAIIGAGPSGLVAAKKCLLMYPGRFKVSLFEKNSRVGGLWAVDPSDQSKIMNPAMPVNISKYSVCFSDFSWESVKISTEDGATPASIPEFPKAWMVGQYLDQYRRQYIPLESLRLNCKVTSVSKVDTNDSTSEWRVKWTQGSDDSSNSIDNEELFNYVIVSTGYLNNPIPDCIFNSSFSTIGAEKAAKIIHSSKFRSLDDIAPKNWSGSGDILVYGGSMSGVEVAASLAYQISNRKYSPSKDSFGNPKVYHVTARPFYVFTPYAPTDMSQKSPCFLPIDLAVFDLTSRPVETAVASYGRMDKETAQTFHGLFRLLVGGDQSDLSIALTASSTDDAPYFANTTGASYMEFVRSGDIVPIPGRVQTIELSAKLLDRVQTLKVVSSSGQDCSNIEDIVGAVHATGYTADLGFLSDDLKHLLGYEYTNHRLPLVLTNAQTMNPQVPDIAFVGMHEGSFWGSEESQARIIVKSWVKGHDSSHSNGISKEDPRTTQDIRAGISKRSKDIPQFLYGDFVGHMEQSALQGYATRDDLPWDGRKGPAVPARYTDHGDNLEEAKMTIDKMQETIAKASQGLFVAKVVFLGFQGRWHIHRDIKSSLKTSPSGTFFGMANFYPMKSTNIEYDLDYLYVEEGDFKTDEGFSMKASRRYAYRYKQDTDQLTTWFIKPDSKTVDYLFLDLAIRRESDENSFWAGTGHHPCKPDIYDAKYTFRFRGMVLDQFTIEYKVMGPQKDYISTSIYTR